MSVTVLMELEWVMRGFYELPSPEVSRVFRALVSIEHVSIEDRDTVLAALDAFDGGLDLADTMHLARFALTSCFGTRQRDLVTPQVLDE